MIRPRPGRAGALVLALAAATAATASAQDAASTAGSFGGGAIGVPVSEKSVAKDMLLAIRVLPNGRAGIDGQLPAGCGQASIRGGATIRAGGRFRIVGTATRKPLVGVVETSRFDVSGTLTADGGSGIARATLRVRAKGHKTRRCTSRTVKWTVRRAAEAAGAPAPAPAEGLLYGLTAQDGPNAKRPVVLHVAHAGRAIDRFVMGFRATCDKRRIVVADQVNFSPEFKIGADGAFRNVETFKLTYADVIVRTTIVVRGQFDAAGGVSGKLAVTERFTNRRNGTRVDVCATGTQSWSARP